MTAYDTDEARWQAVKDRDPHAVGSFLYAVKTTGIFCVPGCASRRPRRENVLFYDTTVEAKADGFRPCKRCRPDDPAHADIRSDRMVAACRAIEQADESPALADLAAEAGLSPSHFQRLFTEHVGVSPKIYAQAVRDAKVRAALEAGAPVTRAIFDAGYGSASRFYERAKSRLGMDAATYRKGGQGMDIRYAYAESHLGPILAGFTENGVCSIEFGDDRDSLVRSLRDRFPQAALRDGGPHLHEQVAEIVDFLKTPKNGLSLPLDIQGTAFQQRVWKALQAIPAGQTRTYSQVAESLGMPDAVRAVASACASNRIAVAVPCHRVIRKDGQLAGYHWGLDRKKALLDSEKE